MRRFSAIARATALEIFSEPFVLLVTLAALALEVLAPAMHYHQFGEPTRMARDAVISSVLVGSLVIAVFGTAKTWRREVESGTALVALAHSVSRTSFFFAKTAGAALAVLAFALAATGVGLTMVNGAAIGGAVGNSAAMLERLWGPSLAVALAAIVLPVFAAAALNRFGRFRYVLTANALALALGVAGVLYRFDFALAAKMTPVFVVAAMPAFFFLAVASAAAAGLRMNAALSLTALVFAAFLPFLGNYCLSDAVAYERALSPVRVLWTLLALMPAIGAALLAGMMVAERKL